VARKLCSGCGETKPFADFYKCSRRGDGHQVWCKKCSLRSTKAYQAKVGKSVTHRSAKYGLSIREVERLIQIPTCQACGCHFPTSHAQKFDHCHTGGHFRGVICHACNMACAGTSAEAITRLLACIDYLRRDIERAVDNADVDLYTYSA
jgi:hypothetical protein